MHICHCWWTIGISKNIRVRTCSGLVTVDSVKISRHFAFLRHGIKLVIVLIAYLNCTFQGASFELKKNLQLSQKVTRFLRNSLVPWLHPRNREEYVYVRHGAEKFKSYFCFAMLLHAPLDINLADAHTYIYASPWNMEVRVYVCHDIKEWNFNSLFKAPLDFNLADAHTYIYPWIWNMEVCTCVSLKTRISPFLFFNAPLDLANALVDSLKIRVSFAEYSLLYRVLLQKRPVFLSMLLSILLTHIMIWGGYD